MKIYEELGLTKDQYIYRIRKGLLPRKKRKNMVTILINLKLWDY